MGYQDPNWKPSVRIVPWGFRKLINWVKNQYNNPLVYITENGIGDDSGTLQDDERVLFLKVRQRNLSNCFISMFHFLALYKSSN